MSAEQRLGELDLALPPAPAAVGVYRPALIVGNLCYTSGQLPLRTDGSVITGRVGKNIDQRRGYEAARQAGLTMLATLRRELGTLDRIKRVIKLFGMVSCAEDFVHQPAVINGCSELMGQVFGEDAGIGTRSAVGVYSLPLDAAVEVEGIFELSE